MRNSSPLFRSLQLGPVRIEQVTPRLLRVTGGTDQAPVQAALRRAKAERDGQRGPAVWWVPARRLRALRRRLGKVVDPLFP